MEKKTIITTLGILLVSIILISFASAEFWACFNKGEQIDFCNPKTPDRTCSSSNGCDYCMSNYNNDSNCYNQGNWMVCMGVEKTCSTFGGNHTIDSIPPELTINSPEQNRLYTSRSVLLDFSLNEKSHVYYYDNLYGRGKWTRVCNHCYKHSRKRSFKEGLNNLTFRAVDVVGNEAYQTMTFFIDSKKPKIHKTLPTSRFASGLFEVQYTEENLANITLTYGNFLTGFNTAILSNCPSGEKQWCETSVDLSSYDGKQIEYHFIVKDAAGNVKESKKRNLEVDITAPILNNPASFWENPENSKYVYFTLNITEENFDEVLYTYIDTSGKEREKRLCSRLKDGICEKRKSFRRGEHLLGIQIIDNAGNAIAEGVDFVIDY